MKIKNIDGLSATDLKDAVDKGGRFLYFPYTISFIIVTFKWTSGVYLVRKDESSRRKGFRFTLASFLLGWWGIPWGPKFTMQSMFTNLKGGKDVTAEVMSVVTGYALYEQAKDKKVKQASIAN
jgi:hypothetical protein